MHESLRNVGSYTVENHTVPCRRVSDTSLSPKGPAESFLAPKGPLLSAPHESSSTHQKYWWMDVKSHHGY